MDKIVLDTFEPKAACFEAPPTDPSKVDGCTVEVTFHNSDAPNSPQPSIRFQREKDSYVFAAGSTAIPVVKSLGFNEKSSAVQSALHFSVFLNGVLQAQYPNFKSAKNYTGPDLMPLSGKATHFIASGDIESPDSAQRKATSALLRELLSLSTESKTWFNGTFDGLNDPKVNQKFVPASMRPRVEFLSEQMETYQKFRTGLSTLSSEPTPENKALQNDLSLFTVDLLDYLTTGEGSPQKIRTSLDTLAQRAWRQVGSGELKDLFAYYRKKLEPLLNDSFYKNNSEAKKRVGFLHLSLRNSELEHRAELLGLDEPAAFKKGIEYRLKEAALKSHLAARVKSEMDDANLSAGWLQANIDDISKTILPFFSLDRKTGQPARINIDAKGLNAAVEKMVKDHFIQEREYAIGSLAALRYLLGNSLTEYKMEAWVGGQYTDTEINTTEMTNRYLGDLHSSLSRKIRKSVHQTSVVWPIVQGGIGLAGAGSLTAGLVKGKNEGGYPFIVGGAAGLGTGVGALSCHVLWKSRNQYVTDSICGVAGGLLLGIGSAFIFKPDDRGQPPAPPGPPIDGRNPAPGWGP